MLQYIVTLTKIRLVNIYIYIWLMWTSYIYDGWSIYIYIYIYMIWSSCRNTHRLWICLHVSGTNLSNSIPMNMRNLNTIVRFKNYMYQHLEHHAITMHNLGAIRINFLNKNQKFFISVIQWVVTNVVIQIN